jgi:phenylalanyl-tRNA synthetase beta chain
MIISLNWLKDYVDYSVSPEELADRLTMSGLEVESIEYTGKALENVVVAEILDMGPHPDADKLSLCRVSDGANEYPIVCGASNMKAGDKVALATTGTVLPPGPKFPEGITIKKAKIRGQVSEGMLCAENELGLGTESDGIMILPPGAVPGTRLIDEIGVNDVLLEIAITPNRPDCLSVVGTAREVAAILSGKAGYPEPSISESGSPVGDYVSVEILSPAKCPRYTCRVITGVKIGPSPKWMKTRLESSGIRSINNVVDVTNYVLLELGQPLHAFDYGLVKGKKIIVRQAGEGEIIKTLDGVERKLTGDDLLICDAERAVALAGVMGGADTEVTEGTSNILLESAYFSPDTVRKTSRKTGLKSESSYRFERGVDPEGVVRALDRAAALIAELAGGKVAAGRIDENPIKIEPAVVSVTAKRVNAILGTNISEEEIISIQKRLGLELLSSDNGVLTFKVPTYRVDLTREIDIIEEMARLYGYNNIPVTLPAVAMKTELPQSVRTAQSKFKEIFTANGFYEAINYSFEDEELLRLFSPEGALPILNPISKDGAVMRTSLTAGLVKNVVLNLSRQESDVRIFETGKVYIPSSGDKLPKEINKLAAAATGRKQPELWDREELDFFDLKAILEKAFGALHLPSGAAFRAASEIEFLHPGKSAEIIIDSEAVGYVGELHPGLLERLELTKRVYVAEIDLDAAARLTAGKKGEFKPLPKFPSVRRDIALVVDEGVTAGSIIDEIKSLGSGLIEDARIFDVFTGGSVQTGKKSVAVSLHLRAADKTLTEDEINKIQDKALKKLRLALGAELRTI